MKGKGKHSRQSAPDKGASANRKKQSSARGTGEFVSLRQAVEQGTHPLHDHSQENDPAAMRAERIRRLKEQVDNGSYQPDLRKVAHTLLYDDTDALLGE